MFRLAPTLTAAVAARWGFTRGEEAFQEKTQCDHAKSKKESNFCVAFDCDEQGSDTPRRTKALVES